MEGLRGRQREWNGYHAASGWMPNFCRCVIGQRGTDGPLCEMHNKLCWMVWKAKYHQSPFLKTIQRLWSQISKPRISSSHHFTEVPVHKSNFNYKIHLNVSWAHNFNMSKFVLNLFVPTLHNASQTFFFFSFSFLLLVNLSSPFTQAGYPVSLLVLPSKVFSSMANKQISPVNVVAVFLLTHHQHLHCPSSDLGYCLPGLAVNL